MIKSVIHKPNKSNNLKQCFFIRALSNLYISIFLNNKKPDTEKKKGTAIRATPFLEQKLTLQKKDQIPEKEEHEPYTPNMHKRILSNQSH